MRNTRTFKALTAAVTEAALSQPQFELLVSLSPAERRLLLLLEQGEADTITVRTRASVGNVSECATRLNAKLEAAGDPRRVVCDVRPHVNAHGERGTLGHWHMLEDGDDERAA